MRRLLLTTAIAGAALLHTGCDPVPVYGPPLTPPVEPFFPTEEDALAAAEGLMTRYVDALTLYIGSDGTDSEAIAALVSPEQLADDTTTLDDLRAAGLTLVGAYRYFGLEIQQTHQDSLSEATVQAYVCMDYRESRYVNENGSVLDGEVEWAPFEALITATSRSDLTLDEMRAWTGRDFCEVLV